MRDRELFLAEPHIAALSVAAGPERGPLTLPIWYQYTPGGEAWVLTEAISRKARLIKDAGRFSLMVERTMPTTRYVSVEGPVTRIIPGTDEQLREITERYLPPEQVGAYLEFANAELGKQLAIYLRPERWLTADLGPGALPPTPAQSPTLGLVRGLGLCGCRRFGARSRRSRGSGGPARRRCGCVRGRSVRGR